ncbi:hypothetical protein ACJRO7_024771 [Eucalyptus globulus]|uniref:Uncharacterized protein n=1 Tax=Eucalyptus globulus TaxID=34317 RepID=A0ABD3K8R2_EUCGL
MVGGWGDHCSRKGQFLVRLGDAQERRPREAFSSGAKREAVGDCRDWSKRCWCLPLFLGSLWFFSFFPSFKVFFSFHVGSECCCDGVSETEDKVVVCTVIPR